MIMADVFKFLFIILGLVIVIVNYWLLSQAVFPRMVGRARLQYSLHPIKVTLIGALVSVPLVVVGITMMSKAPNPTLKFIGAVILFSSILGGLLGSAGLSQHIGCGLPSPIDEQQPWRRVLRGGIVLSIVFVLPLIGWFLLLWSLASGLGAAVLSLAQGWKQAEPEEAKPSIEAAA